MCFGDILGAVLEVFLIDVGVFFVLMWEVFQSYIKGMSDVYWMWYQKYSYCIWAGVLDKTGSCVEVRWRSADAAALNKREAAVRLLWD